MTRSRTVAIPALPGVQLLDVSGQLDVLEVLLAVIV
jgi:hypothetical protein